FLRAVHQKDIAPDGVHATKITASSPDDWRDKRMAEALNSLRALAAAACILAGSAAHAADLVIAMPNWFSGQATANILKVSLKKEFGLEADVIEMGTLIAFAGLNSGQVDIHPEAWLPNLDNLVKQYVTDAKTVTLSPIGVPAWQGLCATRTAADKYGIKD